MDVSLYAQSKLPTSFGDFSIRVYRNSSDHSESIVLSRGDISATPGPIFTRIHSECMTGEVFGSLKCDCRAQLHEAQSHIREIGVGLIIYLRQEGRGIGLGNKIKAYSLQEKGANTIEANHHLGFETDLRDFSIAAAILNDLNIKTIELNTNNPHKIDAMKKEGVDVAHVVPSLTALTPYNKSYLETKYAELGHFLEPMFKTPSSD